MPIDRTLKLSTGLAPAAPLQAAAVSGHLWDLMKAASQDRGEFHRAWLALQCGMIAGATAGLLLTREAAKHGEPARYVPQASWPDANRELTHLAQIAERAAGEGRTIVAWARHEGAVQALASAIVAHPIGSGIEGPLAVAAVIVAPRTAVVDPQAVARQLHWGGGWLEMLIARAEAQQSKAQLARAGAGLDLLAVAGGHLDLSAAAMAIANELADRLDCDRVSIGLINRRRSAVHLRAMSRSAIIKRTTRLAELIEDAMEEALDQQSAIAYPLEAETQGRIVLAHKELARAAGDRGRYFRSRCKAKASPPG